MYNVLINNLSTLSLNAKRNNYRMCVGKWAEKSMYEKDTFLGIYTNEAVTHALIRKLSVEKQNEKLDKIFSLATNKVLNEKLDDIKFDNDKVKADLLALLEDYLSLPEKDVLELTHYSFYKTVVQKAIKDEYKEKSEEELKQFELTMDENEDCIEIPNVATASDVYTAVVKMADKIISYYNEHDKKCCFYIDYTGGDRTVSTLLIALTKMLEERGIDVDHIWAVNYDASAHINEINEKLEVKYIFDFISGLQEFINYGRANKLNEFLQKSVERKMISLSSLEKEVQKKISSLADEIQLNRSAEIVEAINNLANAINKYEKDTKSEKNVLFLYLTEDIKNNYNGMIDDENKRTVPNIIQWCLDKDMILQAVTIYTELIPTFLVREKILYFDRDEWNSESGKIGYIQLYENDVRFYVQFGTTDRGWVSQNKRPKTTGYQRYKLEYSYYNYYIWKEIGERAKCDWNYDENDYRKYHNKAYKIVNYIFDNESVYTKIKYDMNKMESPLKSKYKMQLTAFLKNYIIFKEKIRHPLIHASDDKIDVGKIRGNMTWEDRKIFKDNSGNNIEEMSVKLLKDMMGDMLKQVEKIINL